MRIVIWAAWCAMFGIAVVSPSRAQGYPDKPLRFVVPFPPGGGADNLARIVGQRVSENLRQHLVVDNRAGAGGNVAAEVAAHATPDGYTLLQANVEPDMQGRVFMLVGSLSAGMAPIGMAIAGPVADSFGVQIWFVIGGITCLLMAVIAYAVPAIFNLEEHMQRTTAEAKAAPVAVAAES